MRFNLLLVLGSILVLSSCKNKKTDTHENSTLLYHEYHDFESVADSRIDSTKAFSGRKSGSLSDKIEYGYGPIKEIKHIPSYESIDHIEVSFKCFMDKKYPDATFVLAIDDDSISKKNIFWDGRPIVPAKFNAWETITISYKVNKKDIRPECFLKLYIWNKGKNAFLFDDISYSFYKD
ncbi:MAG: hypothetical protein K0S44_33 [Bacteroidetes bacterium]|jgi:hypothetical protein|nr:hypothetical protein [Bacteroidota bacterium]